MRFEIAAESLTVGNFIFKNLLPVTIGNIIGGAGIVGCGYWLAYLHRTPYSHVQGDAEQEEIDIAEEY
jgi:formate/nitrite transporter FocA (FNT family)